MTDIEKLYEAIKKFNNIVFFGGAGVSTESGIPDFRSKDGLYNQKDVQFEKYQPEYLLSHDCLHVKSKVFYEFYRQKMDTRNIQPNTTHYVLAELEKLGKLKAVITQNIDGLDQLAGSKNVIELHGTTKRNYCIKCKKEYDENYIFDAKEDVPRCDCKWHGLIRPDVTLYNEQLPSKAEKDAYNAIKEADMLIVGGTSLSVYPAAYYVYNFTGECITVINKEKLSLMLGPNDIEICDALGEVFDKLKKLIDEKRL